MKLKDFENELDDLDLDLVHVTMGDGGHVLSAMAVKRDGGSRKVKAYYWLYGCCRESVKKHRVADIINNIRLWVRIAPLSWLPVPEYSMTFLEQRHSARK